MKQRFSKDESHLLEPLMCPKCDDRKVYPGVRALNYLTQRYSIDFKCGSGHEWTETEDYKRR